MESAVGSAPAIAIGDPARADAYQIPPTPFPINNFRYNESPVGMLSRVLEVGKTEQTLPREWGDYFNRAAMPSLRIEAFNMSSVSQAS